MAGREGPGRWHYSDAVTTDPTHGDLGPAGGGARGCGSPTSRLLSPGWGLRSTILQVCPYEETRAPWGC